MTELYTIPEMIVAARRTKGKIIKTVDGKPAEMHRVGLFYVSAVYAEIYLGDQLVFSIGDLPIGNRQVDDFRNALFNQSSADKVFDKVDDFRTKVRTKQLELMELNRKNKASDVYIHPRMRVTREGIYVSDGGEKWILVFDSHVLFEGKWTGVVLDLMDDHIERLRKFNQINAAAETEQVKAILEKEFI